jgi:hypothetical protein
MKFPSTEDSVRAEAARQGVDPDVAAAVARQESGFQPAAVSPKGAIGTMQLMPGTAADLGVDPNVPADNIRGGVTYLKQMMDRYGGHVPTALAAYNAGPGRVESARPLPQETKDYVAAISNSIKTAPAPPPAKPDLSAAMTFGPSQPAGPPTKSDQPGFLTRSVIETATGKSAAGEYEKLIPALQNILPESLRGKYVTELATEISKAGPEMVDFLTSPVGIGLTAAHFFPATAPFAAAADVVLGGKQALQAIPDTIDALRHMDDPHKMGKAIVDVLGAYVGLKGGSRVGEALRQMPADTGAGLSAVPKMTAMGKAYADAYSNTAPPPPPPGAADLRARLEAAAPEDVGAIIDKVTKPTSLRGALEQKIYQTPGVREVANLIVPGVKKPPILDLGQALVDERAGEIAVQHRRVQEVTDWIKRNVPEEDQNIRRLGYAMEGDLPESMLSPEGREALGKIRNLNRERDQMLRSVYGKDLQLMDSDSYIRHYWDFDNSDPAVRTGASSRMMRDLSLRSREISSLKKGIEDEGLTPKYENVADVINRRHMEAVQSVENQKFANTLRDYGLILDPTKANIRNTGWKPATEAPAIMRAVYSGTGESGDVVLRPKAPLVHPDIAMAVNAIYNEPFKGVTFGAINQLRAFSKQIQVGYSLFHNNAISEVSQAQAVAGGGADAIPRAIKAVAWPLDPEFIKGVKNALWEVRGKVAPEAPPTVRLSREAVEPWLKANLTFASSESESAAIRGAMDFLKNRGPLLKAIGAPVRALGDVQYVFNRALFDYYLPGQMLHSAEGLFAREMNRLGPDASPEAVFGLRREIADHVNRAYGAENLQRLLLTPKAQQMLGMAFFAPQWTLSNLRVLGKGFETTTGARLTAKYIAGAALTYAATSQLANYAMSEWQAKHNPTGGEYWDEGTQAWKRGGHWTWQNPGDPVQIEGKYVPGLTDNAANIYAGQNPDGSQRYVRLGKAFREPFMWMTHPIETLGGKLSAPLRAVFVQLAKHEPGSGYAVINDKLRPGQQMEQRVGAAAEMFTPFAARDMLQKLERFADPKVFKESGADTQIAGLPARKGASFYNSVEDLRTAVEANRMDMAQQVMRNAALNGIKPDSLIKEIKSRARSEMRTQIGIPKPAQPTAPPPISGMRF